MATPSRQIGWGAEENLLSFISKQLGNLTNVTYNSGGSGSIGPQGPQGVQGPPGPLGPVGPAGLEWQGAWVSGTSYVADDAVGHNGASWFCILATSGTTAPNLDTTHWALLASQGAQGIQGAQGPTGAQGPAGSLTPITASAPLTGGIITTTGVIGINQATASVNGYLSSTDFTTFTNKENSANKQNSLAADGTGTKFPTVDAVNAGITNSNYWTKTGNIIRNNNTGNIEFFSSTYYVSPLGHGNFNNLRGTYVYASAQYELPNAGKLTCDGNGNNYIQGYRNDKWLSDIKFKYNSDLSSTYDDRTLVDRGYVNNRLVVETAGPYTLANADSGGIVIFTASTTLTIPTGLSNGFECTFVTLAGVTLTVTSTGNTLNNATSSVLPPQSSFTLKRMIATNTFIATGNL